MFLYIGISDCDMVLYFEILLIVILLFGMFFGCSELIVGVSSI